MQTDGPHTHVHYTTLWTRASKQTVTNEHESVEKVLETMDIFRISY